MGEHKTPLLQNPPCDHISPVLHAQGGKSATRAHFHASTAPLRRAARQGTGPSKTFSATAPVSRVETLKEALSEERDEAPAPRRYLAHPGGGWGRLGAPAPPGAPPLGTGPGRRGGGPGRARGSRAQPKDWVTATSEDPHGDSRGPTRPQRYPLELLLHGALRRLEHPATGPRTPRAAAAPQGLMGAVVPGGTPSPRWALTEPFRGRDPFRSPSPPALPGPP